MAPPRVVLDTNVLVCAARWGGVPGAVVGAARTGEIDGVISLHILGEFRDVLMRPGFGHTQADVDLAASRLAGFCDVLVSNAVPGAWCADADDDAIVQTAILGQAIYVVTGDAHLLDLSVPRIRFVTPAELLELTPS
ncbi:MAG: putative toxin-antitoxin system toxin component, PIN family [Coriobacteriia bacterium]|nr:putative toxin-antitoxin system toxin component, PIN family [Coriobacteriia bacterium]